MITEEEDTEAGAASSIKEVIGDVEDMVLEVVIVVGDGAMLLIGSVQLRGLVSAAFAGVVEAVVGIASIWLIDAPLPKEFAGQSVG